MEMISSKLKYTTSEVPIETNHGIWLFWDWFWFDSIFFFIRIFSILL